MIGERSRLSLAQYLGLQAEDFLDVLFRKHSLRAEWEESKAWLITPARALLSFVPELALDRLLSVLEEVVSTEADLRERARGPYGDGLDAYRARWGDLKRCLSLDGYEMAGGMLRAVEPELQGAASEEDALTAEVRSSALGEAPSIVAVIGQSARDFIAMAAERQNAENLLIIHDPALAVRYAENWQAHATHSAHYVGR